MNGQRLSLTRVVFLGTPSFALPSLNALARASAEVVGAVTQPEKPAGRSHTMRASAVARRAAEIGIPVFTPNGLKKEAQWKFFLGLRPDLLVVVAYGNILPQEVLDLPKFGAVNVHASLLPKYRGPAPIPAAILAGDTETGVTIMKLDAGTDTGPVLALERVPIGLEDTTAALTGKLAEIGAHLLIPTLERYLSGELSPTPQDPARASVCTVLKKADGMIHWNKPAAEIARAIRAYDPWPRTFTTWNGKRLIVRKALPAGAPLRIHAANPQGTPAAETVASKGKVFRDSAGIKVTTGSGALLLQELQLEGGTPLPAETFVQGYPQFVGSVLGDR